MFCCIFCSDVAKSNLISYQNLRTVSNKTIIICLIISSPPVSFQHSIPSQLRTFVILMINNTLSHHSHPSRDTTQLCCWDWCKSICVISLGKVQYIQLKNKENTIIISLTKRLNNLRVVVMLINKKINIFKFNVKY